MQPRGVGHGGPRAAGADHVRIAARGRAFEQRRGPQPAGREAVLEYVKARAEAGRRLARPVGGLAGRAGEQPANPGTAGHGKSPHRAGWSALSGADSDSSAGRGHLLSDLLRHAVFWACAKNSSEARTLTFIKAGLQRWLASAS